MDSKKYTIVGLLAFLFLSSIVLNGCKEENMHQPKHTLIISEIVGNENIDDLSLTIYYMSPYILTDIPLSVEDLIASCGEQKVVINGSDLEKHIDLLKQIGSDNLIPVEKKSVYIDFRLYYVLESKKNGKLIDIAMWGGENNRKSIFINGYEVEENNVFYDAVIPFLPDFEVVKDIEKWINRGGLI